MAEDEQLSKNQIDGDAEEDAENCSQWRLEKKQKLDDESDETEDLDEDEDDEEEVHVSEEDDGSDYSMEEFTISDKKFEILKPDYCPEGVEEIDEDVWIKYLKEISESEGFDIYHYPGMCLMARYHPIDIEKYPLELEELIDFSNAALLDFNQKEGTKYKLEKVEKANRQLAGPGCNYYITFQAKDSVADAFKTFQALVWWGIVGSGSESSAAVVKFCRLKAAAAT
ncbi:uncharacterized protein [Coffea arabica]|uniref:Cystatin domain-containing protein n=1 Tax=Coffea arabica TaxID=13443 RepID=A0A6P6VHV2_COFAR|nr:UPF0725 protein At4g17990-like [Coffea arabica]